MSMGVREYAVIEFDEGINNNKAVELVPIDWLIEDETLCFWPPKNQEHKVQEWVKDKCGPGKAWKKYPIKILSKARDYDQGLRRLQRSYKKNNVDSTESDSQYKNDDQPSMMNSASVAQVLAKPVPLNTTRTPLSRSFSIDHTESVSEVHEIDGSAIEPKEINNQDDLAKYLQRVIHLEMYSIRKSLNYHIGQKFQKVMEVIQYSADPSRKHQAWENVGEDLPFEDMEKFVTFDESLKTSEEKRNALIDVFQMISAGCTKCEDDVHNIMGKMIKKDIQLKYSGCGQKINGVGKKPFRDTETFKAMEEFSTAKYHDSKEKPGILTAVSTYLSGAKDRDGGRAKRNKQKCDLKINDLTCT